jgi:hypothetical protein
MYHRRPGAAPRKVARWWVAGYRRRMLAARLALALALGAGACAVPAQPRRLGSPLLGGARLPDGWRDHTEAPPDADDDGGETEAIAAAPRRPVRPAPPMSTPSVPMTEIPLVPCTDAATTLCTVRIPDGLDVATLPAPHRTPDRYTPAQAADAIVAGEAVALRRLVGTRIEGEPLAFALATASRLIEAAPPAIETGPDLIAWAETHGTLGERDAFVRAGDLLVFDRVIGGEPASLTAVAIGRDGRGVVEMVYLGGGVVRRGFVDPARPRTVRDGERRIVNTFLRHGREWPPGGTRYLAGELLAHVVRLR